MKIATWNVNSMNVREPHVVEWLQNHEPDVLVLQEIKQVTEKFPAEALLELGYHSIASGQKTYNGVAVISKTPPVDPVYDFPDLEDPQRRVLASTVGDIRVDADVHDPEKWGEAILCSPPEREALGKLIDLGLADVFRKFEHPERTFSWWDYRAAGFRRNAGLRIDLILTSDAMTERCTASYVDKEPRAWERPSDHAPVVAEFEF